MATRTRGPATLRLDIRPDPVPEASSFGQNDDISNVQKLRVGQCVTLDLGKADTPLDCVVTGIAGATATLVQRADHSTDLLDRLSAGISAYLVISDENSVIGLRGAAIVTPESRPLIEFVVTDGVAA